MSQKVWFTSDLHFGHKNIMKHCPTRQTLVGTDDIEVHDKWLIELWNKTVNRKDTVYIIGDFSFKTSEDTKKLLGKLNGNKILILGNHDKSSKGLTNYFNQITQIKEVVFKPSLYKFLEEPFKVVMCHFPILEWSEKHNGSIMLHGHSHGKVDIINEQTTDLRFDVGIDGKLGNYNFVSLEDVYKAVKNKQTLLSSNQKLE